jgi:hypothetical protein
MNVQGDQGKAQQQKNVEKNSRTHPGRTSPNNP